MDLARLRRIIDGLIEEEGENAPVAVFYMTARDVAEATEFLRSAGKIENGSRPRVEDVLAELQDNAGDPPFDDQLLEKLQELLIHWEDGED